VPKFLESLIKFRIKIIKYGYTSWSLSKQFSNLDDAQGLHLAWGLNLRFEQFDKQNRIHVLVFWIVKMTFRKANFIYMLSFFLLRLSTILFLDMNVTFRDR
jgi:hypothetical protein